MNWLDESTVVLNDGTICNIHKDGLIEIWGGKEWKLKWQKGFIIKLPNYKKAKSLIVTINKLL